MHTRCLEYQFEGLVKGIPFLFKQIKSNVYRASAVKDALAWAVQCIACVSECTGVVVDVQFDDVEMKMLYLPFLTSLRKLSLSFFTLATFAGISAPAFSYSHGYINTFRTSTSNVFVSQTLEGDYGQFELNGKEVVAEDGTVLPSESSADWRGTGFRTSVGIEIMKFIQFSTGHTFVNMRSQEDALEHMSGSKIHAETKLIFLAPIGNLELGVGVSSSRLDYQRVAEMSGFVGTGTYFSVGMNYFLSSKFSVFGAMKSERSHLVRNGGSSSIRTVDTETTNIGAGFTIWM